MTEPYPLLEVQNLTKWFPIRSGMWSRDISYVKAVNGVSFQLEAGKTLGVVGESGCGKSTLGRMIIRLVKATSGSIFFEGRDFLALRGEELLERRQGMQIIFQDAYASLNPRMTVADIIREPLDVRSALPNAAERNNRVLELMDICGLDKSYVRRYPHEFSGGQRQRIGIARALALNPSLVICDEPVSALDVSIQAQILNLLIGIQKEKQLAYLFISHDLSVINYVSDYVAVMYLGYIVELAEKKNLFVDPRHPYSKALLSAVPIADTRVKRERFKLKGSVPSPINLPVGCSFQSRCDLAMKICFSENPVLQGEPGHLFACHQR